MSDLMTQTDLRAHREAVVREHIDAENNHDVTRSLGTFRHARYDVAPVGSPFDGSEAVHDLLSGLFSAFPDFNVDPGPLMHCDDAVFVEVQMTGTHDGDWFGVPATGRHMAVRVACLFEFAGQDLVCERVYFDFATFLRQVGVLPE